MRLADHWIHFVLPFPTVFLESPLIKAKSGPTRDVYDGMKSSFMLTRGAVVKPLLKLDIKLNKDLVQISRRISLRMSTVRSALRDSSGKPRGYTGRRLAGAL